MKNNNKWKLVTYASLVLTALSPISSSVMAVESVATPNTEVKDSKKDSAIQDKIDSNKSTKTAIVGPSKKTINASKKQVISDTTSISNKNVQSIASGTHGTVNWEINDAGELHLSAGTIPSGDAGLGSGPFLPYASKITKIVIDGPIVAQGHVSIFAALNNVTEIQGLDKFDTSKVTDMNGMFNKMAALKTIDVSSFDTSNVTNMAGMFANDGNLTSINVSGLDTSKVTNMAAMFEAVKAPSVDMSSFDTSNVTDMSAMFAYDTPMTSIDVSNFNTSKVTNMASMFIGIGTSNLDLSNFNTSNVTNMAAMFYRIENMDTINLNSFDTSKVTDMSSMFLLTKFKTLDLSNFKTPVLTAMKGMFSGDEKLTTLNIAGIDTSNVTDMTELFKDDAALNTLTLGSKFKYVGGTVAALPEITKQGIYSGKWINLNSGTTTAPKGDNIWASSEFMNNYDGSKDADTYIWQTAGKNVTVKYVDEDGNSLDSDIVMSGYAGDDYKTTQKTFDGYTFKEIKGSPATGKFSDVDQTVTYVYSKDKSATVNVHNSTIYVGDSWSAQDNWDNTLDEDGNNVDFAEIQKNGKIEGSVDTTKAGTYQIKYTYQGVTAVATIVVKDNLSTMKVHDSTLYVGDSWTPKDNWDSATYQDGSAVDFSNIMTDKLVDTTKAGVYEVNYSIRNNPFGLIDLTALATAKATITVKNNLSSIKGSDVTKHVGDAMPDDSEFKASAVDKDGVDSPVTLDKTKVDMSKVGDYDVVITAADGQTKTVQVHVLEDQRSITGSDVDKYVGDAMPEDSEFNASAKDIDGNDSKVTLDKSKVDMSKVGDYDVVITAADGQTKTVQVHVREHKEVPEDATVIVQYVDQDGNAIAKDDILMGHDGDKYTTKAKDVDGYELVNTPKNKEGIFVHGTTKVVYSYNKVKDETPATPNKPEAPKGGSKTKTVTVQKKKLPQTGERILVNTIGTVVGMLSLLSAFYLVISKKKKTDK